MMDKLDDIDKAILNETQKGIVLESRPFKDIALKLSVSEDAVVDRINKLKEDGYIRRFGGMFNSEELGFVSTLVAVKVEGSVDDVARIVNGYSGVTHNYQREDEYNLWFTLMASSQEDIEKILKEIKEKTNIKDFMSLPSINKHKVHVYLNF